MKKVLLTIIIVLLLEGFAVFLLGYSGVYSVSLLNHDTPFINRLLMEGRERSIKRNATGITVPPLDDPARVRAGSAHYKEMCAQCHGAPGGHPGEIAKGLWPEAPDLEMSASDWTPAELFWITKNGIKFSAMPAWGPTYSDDKIWDIVAFVQKLPNLSDKDYEQMTSGSFTDEKRPEK
ncbi:MAG TPA: cytochrome c [Chthoniobacter sp.]|jgi:mono/diheme cytochrome c family protein